MDTTTEEHRIQTLRQTIADLERRKVELLADLTTLEAAIAAIQRRLPGRHGHQPQKDAPDGV